MNVTYAGPADCPAVIPVFPLSGALLLPRGQMPLNIFEPRYLAMVDAVLGGSRVIGMVQPEGENGNEDHPPLYRVGCAGRVVKFGETGDGRYLLSLTGIARFRIDEELSTTTPYRQCRVSYDAFSVDFKPRLGEADVDRPSVLAALRRFTQATELEIDWPGIETTPNEALVNALSMMAPFGAPEKQALLEAADLKTRAEMLVALTDIELAKSHAGPRTTLQ